MKDSRYISDDISGDGIGDNDIGDNDINDDVIGKRTSAACLSLAPLP